MNTDAIQAVCVDLRNASMDEYAALCDFQNRLDAVRMPEDPPTPLEEFIARWKHSPETLDSRCWVVWNDVHTAIIANANTWFWRTDDNKHALDFGINVMHDHRQRGLARLLLGTIVDYAAQQNRRLLITNTNDRDLPGEAFMLRLGAERGLQTHMNQLAMDMLSHDLVRGWLQRVPERASDFELGFWDGSYPEEELEAIAQLHNVMNTAPRGTLDMEDFHVTSAMLRDWERAMAANSDRSLCRVH